MRLVPVGHRLWEDTCSVVIIVTTKGLLTIPVATGIVINAHIPNNWYR